MTTCNFIFCPHSSYFYTLQSWRGEPLDEPPLEETPSSSRKGTPSGEESAIPNDADEAVFNSEENEDADDEVSDEDELDDHGPFGEFDEDDEELKISPGPQPAGETLPGEFESGASVMNYGIQVTEDMVERSATAMSKNARIVSEERTSKFNDSDLDPARIRAIQKAV